MIEATLHRCDVVLVTFPFTDLSGSKRRPAVVLGTESHQGDIILGFISSVVPDVAHSYEVLLIPTDSDFSQTGLKVPSVIRLNKLATIDRKLITRRIGHLSHQRYHEIDNALTKALGIDVSRYIRSEHKRLAQLLTREGIDALVKAVRETAT